MKWKKFNYYLHLPQYGRTDELKLLQLKFFSLNQQLKDDELNL